MADGAGTPYCADEGFFSPLQLEHLRANALWEAKFEQGRRETLERLQGQPCEVGKQHSPVFTVDGWRCAHCRENGEPVTERVS
jgi:hypothetical protein